jgi:xylulokinase
MFLLGIDLGTSSVKVSVVDAATLQTVAMTQYPETENEIIALHSGWAEQSPTMWWEHVQLAVLKLHAQRKYNPGDIAAIGIAYQMHGLVAIDKSGAILRNSIIWCDSRAVALGDKAFKTIGKERCLQHMLNSPGNFTASKLAWVKQNEPSVYEKIDKIMLPGDFIAMKMTGQPTTSIAALSEGIFWDFKKNELSNDVFDYFELDKSFIPPVNNVFSTHGYLTSPVAETLSLKKGIPVTYKAGDQPNNALSSNAMQPGEFAATAGTSGVIYGVTDQLTYDIESRVNTFAHVNHAPSDGPENDVRLGVLLCVNGTGILNRWLKDITGHFISYTEMTAQAKTVNPGSDGLLMFPFGNGAERMLNNRIVGASVSDLDFNIHHQAHLFRAAQEGIAFALRYGLDIMKENGMVPKVIRAAKANMFLSEVFTESFVNTTNVAVEFYDGDGSFGAALGAGIGCGLINMNSNASPRKPLAVIEPRRADFYNQLYENWKEILEKKLAVNETLLMTA